MAASGIMPITSNKRSLGPGHTFSRSSLDTDCMSTLNTHLHSDAVRGSGHRIVERCGLR